MPVPALSLSWMLAGKQGDHKEPVSQIGPGMDFLQGALD